jgi:hypothetical protein
MLLLNVTNISFIEISDGIKDIRLVTQSNSKAKNTATHGGCFVCNFVTDTLRFRSENTEFHEFLQFGNTHFMCLTSACWSFTIYENDSSLPEDICMDYWWAKTTTFDLMILIGKSLISTAIERFVCQWFDLIHVNLSTHSVFLRANCVTERQVVTVAQNTFSACNATARHPTIILQFAWSVILRARCSFALRNTDMYISYSAIREPCVLQSTHNK